MECMQYALRSLLLLLLASPCLAMDLGEARIKAGFLYNFVKHTEWPSADKERVLCTVGQHLPNKVLDELDGLPLNEATLRIRKVDTPDQAETCHILFIGYSDRSAMSRWLNTVQMQPILTVSDIVGAGRPRSMINLFTEGRHLRYDINNSNVRASGLKLNSRLINLADTVYDN